LLEVRSICGMGTSDGRAGDAAALGGEGGCTAGAVMAGRAAAPWCGAGLAVALALAAARPPGVSSSWGRSSFSGGLGSSPAVGPAAAAGAGAGAADDDAAAAAAASARSREWCSRPCSSLAGTSGTDGGCGTATTADTPCSSAGLSWRDGGSCVTPPTAAAAAVNASSAAWPSGCRPAGPTHCAMSRVYCCTASGWMQSRWMQGAPSLPGSTMVQALRMVCFTVKLAM
jgi:hypothetical protein